MRIHLDQIGPEGYDFAEPLTAAWIATTLGKDSPFNADTDGRLQVHLVRLDHGVVYVHGHANLGVVATCARCLDRATFCLDSDLDVTLFPRGQEPEPKPSGELVDEDMGIAVYEDDEIDLAQLVHDEVFLGLPMIPLCREDCRGLCPTCGENLNDQQCQCQPAVDKRWQGLLKLKAG